MIEPAASPLDPDQLRTLLETRKLAKKIRLARGIALANVISLGLLAVLSLLAGVFSLSVSPVAVALALLAYNEERGRRQLLVLDVRAPHRLALNQLALFLLVLVYCAWNSYTAFSGPDPLSVLASQSPEIGDTLDQLGKQMDGSAADLGTFARVASLLVYAVVLFSSFVVQGLTALYYRSLRSSVEALARAPEWAKALE